MTEKRNWRLIFKQAVVAGILAGITLEAYLLLTTVFPVHGSVVQTWQWIASAAFGEIAYSSPSYALVGLVCHFIVSIAWAGGYAYLAQQQPFMNQRWIISGLVYGLIVYLFMDILLLGVRLFVPPSPLMLINVLIAHCVFFGLPVAFVTQRLAPVPSVA
jgi:uncharacterized membrane protein YagU involved in acid resistance